MHDYHGGHDLQAAQRRHSIMITTRSFIGSALSLFALVATGACTVDATQDATDSELGTTQQELSRISIWDGTHYSKSTYTDEEGVNHSRSSLKTRHLSGNCKDGSMEENYEFEANYASQGLRTKGTLFLNCVFRNVVAKTSRNTYHGRVEATGEDTTLSEMHWETSTGVTWLINRH